VPGTDIYAQGIATALLSDKPDAQSLAKAIADGAAKVGVKVYANASNRGAVLTGAAAPTRGMVTYLTAEDRVDYWDGVRWVPITPGPWIPLPLAAGIVANSGSPAYRLVNGSVQLRGTLGRTAGAKFSTAGALVLATLPAGYRPSYWTYEIVGTEWVTGISGRLELNPSGELTILIVGGGSGPAWVSVNASYALA